MALIKSMAVTFAAIASPSNFIPIAGIKIVEEMLL
jgi:hypothetical protein